MLNFKEISTREAFDMILEDDLKNLYFLAGGDIACVERYRISFTNLTKERYFKKEETE